MAPSTVDVARRRMLTGILFLTIACCFAFIHMYHVSSLFENNHHFSHLSTVEREMTFRTEMGMYYSYYKRLVEAPTYNEGINQLTHDNLTEYPNVINTLHRFNLVPEVLIGFGYRSYVYLTKMMNMQTKECWQIIRSPLLPLVTSCEGLGDPIYFYLQVVWCCAGLTVLLLFSFGTFLSDSLIGGLVTVMCFFYNHNEATRVQWTPPLRESFAYPFILLHIFYITYAIKKDQKTVAQGQRYQDCKLQNSLEIFGTFLSATTCLMLWQFSQFVLAVQIIATYALFVFKLISKDLVFNVLYGMLIATVFTAIIQSGIVRFLGSVLPCLVVGMIVSINSLEYLLKYRSMIIRMTAHTTWVIFATFAIRNKLGIIFPNEDDGHIYNILMSKLGSYKDFHTLLYTCSAEFDFLPLESIRNLTRTLLLPSAIIVVLYVICVWIHVTFNSSKDDTANQPPKERFLPEALVTTNPFRFIEPHMLYVFLLLGAFATMAIMIMRLKLFFTPHLCIMVSILASRKYFCLVKSERLHMTFMMLMLGGMSYQGLQNIKDQHAIIGEFLNLPFEELLNWVKTETEPTAVFAGPMPIMANLLLTTGRPIVNHPHYENYALRERTKKVYSIFSRKSTQEVFDTLSTMKVQYVILEKSWCFGSSRMGCGMTDLWDVEDPKNRKNPPLCPILFEGKSPLPFHRVFSNEAFVVLKVHFKIVEIRPPTQYKE